MNLNFLCCIGAEQKHDQSGLLKMNQVYFYRAYADETMSEILEDNFFNHSESHLKENDIILAYSPNEQDLPKVRWLRIVIPHAGLVKTEKVDNSYLLEVLRNDLGDLGDQVAEIEAKIPGSASVINQLATQNDITNKITNCITEIPQDIKLELNNGTLTLKAGSKVYVPNGSGVFDEITLTADKTATQTPNDTRMYFYNGSYIEKFPIAQCFSGSSAPSGYTYMFWYDTTNNVVKKTSNSGSTWESGWSLPFCIATASGGALTNIDQVFNGFGYIGSTVFALPGVKGLTPDGRNEDGTLKNISVTTQKVLTATRNSNLSNAEAAFTSTSMAIYLREHIVDELPTTSTNGQLVYLRPENKLYTYFNGWVKTNICAGMFFDKTNNGIENFSTKTTFHAVDYSDFENAIEELDNSAVHKTGDETIGGEKTFTSGTIWKKEGWDATQNPNSNKFATWSQVIDKNDSMLSYIETSYLTDGTIQQTIGARKEINGTKHTAGLSLRVDSSGNKTFALSDNPPSSSNGSQVATTYWANAKFLPLAGGTITGVITTKNQIMFENTSSVGHRGFLYKVSDGGLAMGIQNSTNSGWQSYQSFFTNGQYLITVSDGTNSKQLSAKPDGTLTWNGINISAMSMPSSTQKNLTLGSSGATYTAPADGWICLVKKATANGQYLHMSNDAASSLQTVCSATGSGATLASYVPVKKGDSVNVLYTAGGTTTAFFFAYAEGAKHLA